MPIPTTVAVTLLLLSLALIAILFYAGEIRSVKIGRLRRIPVDAVQQYIAALAEKVA